jgi:hypothetical protein
MSSVITHPPEIEDVGLEHDIVASVLQSLDAHEAAIGRRGPFRPGRLVPARARLQVRGLSRLFHVLDAAALSTVTVAVIQGGRLTPAAFAPLVLGAVTLLVGLHALEAYAFRRL